MASAEAEIRHVFGATCLTEGSIGAAPPDIVKLSGNYVCPHLRPIVGLANRSRSRDRYIFREMS